MKTKKAFFSIDALMTLIPLLLMLTFVFQLYGFTVRKVNAAAQNQELFDKLVSIADYTLKVGAIENNQVNWIDESKLSPLYSLTLEQKAEISNLYVSTSQPSDNYDVCIYRIVVVGSDKSIGKLFVCGDYANN